MLNSATTNQLTGPPHFVDLHVNSGESVSIQFFDGNETILRGPTTIKMISQHAYPPMPMPVQVPPGHMIQQIVDENGTLRHIILSALNGGNGNSYSPNSTFTPHHSASNSAYCCCCYNTCSSGTSSQPNSMTSSLSTQQVQPHLSQNPIFPLSQSYVRHRRSNRGFSSPNSKRPSNYSSNYYNSNPTNKVSSGRYKSDNLKNNHYNRHSTALHYDSTRPYDFSNETKYLNKNYDYSCNSSNASQASTADQIIDNIKYYKEDGFAKKSFDANDVDSSKETNSYYLDCNHQSILTNEQDSYNSSQNEDLNQDTSLSSENFDVNYNKLRSAGFVNYSNEPANLACELNSDDLSAEKSLEDISFEDVNDKNKANFYQFVDEDAKKRIPKGSSGRKEATIDLPRVEAKLRINCDESKVNANLLNLDYQNEIEQLENNETCDETSSIESAPPKVDKTKLLANGGLELYSARDEPVHVICPEDINQSEINDLDQLPDEEMTKTNSLTTQRSPRHLLPKREVINLAYNSLSSNSVRLKWLFTQTNDHCEHKKHFVVDMMHGNAEDSPNSRIVYQGHTVTCRVSHLQPQKEYTFRVRTSTEEAVLVSNFLTVITPEQSSTGAKPCGRKSKQQLQQQLMQQQQQIYQQQQLLLQQQQLVEERQISPVQSGALFQNILSRDQRCAIIILLCFTFLALIVAEFIQRFLSPN